MWMVDQDDLCTWKQQISVLIFSKLYSNFGWFTSRTDFDPYFHVHTILWIVCVCMQASCDSARREIVVEPDYIRLWHSCSTTLSGAALSHEEVCDVSVLRTCASSSSNNFWCQMFFFLQFNLGSQYGKSNYLRILRFSVKIFCRRALRLCKNKVLTQNRNRRKISKNSKSGWKAPT